MSTSSSLSLTPALFPFIRQDAELGVAKSIDRAAAKYRFDPVPFFRIQHFAGRLEDLDDAAQKIVKAVKEAA